MGIYDMGAAQSIVDHAKRTLQKVKGYAGSSAGAIVACILLTTPDKVLVRKYLICYSVCMLVQELQNERQRTTRRCMWQAYIKAAILFPVGSKRF